MSPLTLTLSLKGEGTDRAGRGTVPFPLSLLERGPA